MIIISNSAEVNSLSRIPDGRKNKFFQTGCDVWLTMNVPAGSCNKIRLNYDVVRHFSLPIARTLLFPVIFSIQLVQLSRDDLKSWLFLIPRWSTRKVRSRFSSFRSPWSSSQVWFSSAAQTISRASSHSINSYQPRRRAESDCSVPGKYIFFYYTSRNALFTSLRTLHQTLTGQGESNKIVKNDNV